MSGWFEFRFLRFGWFVADVLYPDHFKRFHLSFSIHFLHLHSSPLYFLNNVPNILTMSQRLSTRCFVRIFSAFLYTSSSSFRSHLITSFQPNSYRHFCGGYFVDFFLLCFLLLSICFICLWFLLLMYFFLHLTIRSRLMQQNTIEQPNS